MLDEDAHYNLLLHLYELRALVQLNPRPQWVGDVIGTQPDMAAVQVLQETIEALEERLSRDKVDQAEEELIFAADMHKEDGAWLLASWNALVKQAEAKEATRVVEDDPMQESAAEAERRRAEPCAFDLDAEHRERMTAAVNRHGFAAPLPANAHTEDDAFLGDRESVWSRLYAGVEKSVVEDGTYFARSQIWTIKALDDLYKQHRAEELMKQAGLVDGDAWGPDRVWQRWTEGRLAERFPPPAEDLEFVRRLVVVHVKALKAIQDNAKREGGAESVTDGYEMDSLVQNVAHLLKYRRCVKLAKLLYKRQGIGSLHDQYEAKLLNKEYSHAHQDERDTEMGIARRMIRQAHVSNYVHYTYTEPMQPRPEDQGKGGKAKGKQEKEEQKEKAYVDKFDRGRPFVLNKKKKTWYFPEEYTTNPPMAPIMCAAPPRMGKSRLTLLAASFAVKLGGHVEYGVAPNKDIPVNETIDRIDRLCWNEQGFTHKHARNKSATKVTHIDVYSEDEAITDIPMMNLRIHKLANDVHKWVLHVRDEAQHVFKLAPRINTQLADSFPIFYGLNMCVSATLLPACMEGELLGNLNSVRELLEVKKGGLAFVTRSALEKYAILQRWSFPIGPDFLVPPVDYFLGNDQWVLAQSPDGRGRYPADFVAEDDGWYKDIYEPAEVPARRGTNYYGTWLHVEEYTGEDANYENGKRYLESGADVFLDDCLQPSRGIHRKIMNESAAYKKMKLFDLGGAYALYLKEFNRRNHKYFDEASGDIVADARKRVANQPIHRITQDAAWVLDHARTWMDEDSVNLMATDNGNGNRLHPMLITAPDVLQSRRMEWVAVLLKVAWWRMHEEFMNNVSHCRECTAEQLRERYGMVVLMYQSEKAHFDMLAADKDIGQEVPNRKVIAITFDPTLPENRFPIHAFENAPELPTGTMESSIFIPTLTSGHYEAYHRLFKTLTHHLKEKTIVPEHQALFQYVNAFQFLLRGCPPYKAFIKGSERKQTANTLEDQAQFPPIVHRLYRFDTENCWLRVPNPMALDADEQVDAETEEHEGSLAGGGDLTGQNHNYSGCDQDATHHRDGRQRPEPYATPPGTAGGGNGGGGPPQQPQAPQQGADGAYSMPRCGKGGGDDDPDDGPKRRLPNLNAIALRLCVNGYENAQDAIKAVHENCSITKVAAAGYKMFEAGLTIQTTFKDKNAHMQMFVPKYMTMAMKQPLQFTGQYEQATKNKEYSMAPNLSSLYQMLGRGFVDTKNVRLPKDWKLVVLSRPGVRNYVKLYGNSELLLSRPRNESIEGRKLALGSLLASVTNHNSTKAPYDEIKGKWLGKKETGSRSTNDQIRRYTLHHVLSMDVDDEKRLPTHPKREVGRWPFHVMRDCLDGAHKPTNPDTLTDGERRLEQNCSVFKDSTLELERYEGETLAGTHGLQLSSRRPQ
jgi:hypothetical protein